jgi:hypothetical protein
LRTGGAEGKPGLFDPSHRQGKLPSLNLRAFLGDRYHHAVPVDLLVGGQPQLTSAGGQGWQRQRHLPRHAGGIAELLEDQ